MAVGDEGAHAEFGTQRPRALVESLRNEKLRSRTAVSVLDVDRERRLIDLRLVSGELRVVIAIEIIDKARAHAVLAGG